MKHLARNVAAVALVTIGATACSGGGIGGAQPPLTQVSLAVNKAQLGVGVATFSDGSHGLSVVATFRKPSGNSGTLVNTPTITGPFTVRLPAGSACPGSSFGESLIGKAYLAGFAGVGADFKPVDAAGSDAGTHTIRGSAQTQPGQPVPCSSLGEGGGVFSYGLSLQNQTPDQVADVGPKYFFLQPLYSVALQTGQPYLGGPPAYPNVQTGTYPAGFAGFSQGFLTFALGAPPAGMYSLNILVPAANAAPSTFTASTSLSSGAGLPAFTAAPTVAEDPAAGGGLTVTFTAPPGVTESIVDIVDVGPNAASGIAPRSNLALFYTLVVNGSGPQTAVLPANLGPVDASGAGSKTIAPGDNYTVSVVGADYPLFEAGPPRNTSLTPTITGANGQADLTFAPIAGNMTTVGYAFKARSPQIRSALRT